MPSQPLLSPLLFRHGPLETAPEFGGVAGFVEVNQFVGDDVFGDGFGQQHRLSVEVEPIAFAAGAPAVAQGLDLDAGRVNFHS